MEIVTKHVHVVTTHKLYAITNCSKWPVNLIDLVWFKRYQKTPSSRCLRQCCKSRTQENSVGVINIENRKTWQKLSKHKFILESEKVGKLRINLRVLQQWCAFQNSLVWTNSLSILHCSNSFSCTLIFRP